MENKEINNVRDQLLELKDHVHVVLNDVRHVTSRKEFDANLLTLKA